MALGPTLGGVLCRTTFGVLCVSLVVINTTFSVMGPILPQGRAFLGPLSLADHVHAGHRAAEHSKKLTYAVPISVVLAPTAGRLMLRRSPALQKQRSVVLDPGLLA